MIIFYLSTILLFMITVVVVFFPTIFRACAILHLSLFSMLVYIYIDTFFLFYHSFIDMLRRKEEINHPFSKFIFKKINFYPATITPIPQTIRERKFLCFFKDINEQTNLLRQQKQTHIQRKIYVQINLKY